MLCVTNMLLHGIEDPSFVRHDNTLARPYISYGQADRVDIVLTNPPFGGREEDGIESNFPHFSTKETADLFLALIVRLLKPGGPRRRGAARRLAVRRGRQDPAQGASDGGVQPAHHRASAQQRLQALRLDRHQPAVLRERRADQGPSGSTSTKCRKGRKAYSMTKPIRFEHLQGCIDWWGGDGVVAQLAEHLARTQPGLRGFTRPNLFRMRQFYETYQADVIVSPLVRQLPWTHNIIILNQSKRPEEREFYLRLAIRERWSKRELERQFKTALFERTVLNPVKVTPLVTQIHPDALSIFKDSYLVEFLDLPESHAEADLQRGLLQRLKDFLIELGRDFCFLGSEYPLQVGGRDFALDLLFFHRGLNCLVAIELKVGRFEPEYLGKLGFYLEALDRDAKKPHEQPAIGVLLCASKDDEVVEYALSRSLSPALIAEYQTQLPDKALLQAKLHEFYLQNAPDEDAEA
jgi:predicted nuclease of restriction endonuclease-like (RecB) superfamily